MNCQRANPARELAPPREAVGGLYTMVLKNRIVYEQMIHFRQAQGDEAQEVAVIFEKMCAILSFLEVRCGNYRGGQDVWDHKV